MAKNNETTTKFKVDISELKAGIQDANRQIRLANAEFKAASSSMDDWGKSADGVGAKIKQLETVLDAENTKLESLKKQLKLVEKEQGENSKGADELRIAIANQQAVVNKTEKSLNNYKSQLDELGNELKDVETASENAEDSLEDMGDGFTTLKGAAASLIADGIKAIGSSLINIMEESREFRTEMGKLETAFAESAVDVDVAKSAYKDFYSVLGDEGQATEAVSFLAKLVDNEKQLTQWTDICAGVYGEFGSSLPIEGLTEAANETAKVGQITGGLADALNWTTMSVDGWAMALGGNQKALDAFNKATSEGATTEDAFNAALGACADEQERASLITDTLATMYGNSAEKFRENNASIIDANKANADLAEAQAELGETIEPLQTAWTKLKTGAMQWIIDEGLPGLRDGWQWVKDNIPTVATLVGALTAAWLTFGGAQKIVDGWNKVMAISQAALNAVMNANPIGLIVTAIGLLVAAFIGLWNNCEGFRNFFIGMWEGIKNAVNVVVNWIKENWQTMLLFLVNPLAGIFKYCYEHFEGFRNFVDGIVTAVKDFFIGMWDGIKNGAQAVWDFISGIFITAATWFNDTVIQPIKDFFTSLWEGIVQAYHTVIDPWIEIVKRLAQMAYDNIIKPIADFVTDLWEGIKEGAQTAWDFVSGIFETVATWFNDNVITPVKDFFVELWEKVSTAASDAWQGVKDTFKAVATWFNDTVITPVKDFFTGMWDGLKTGAKNAWQGVKDTFSTVATFFKNIFSEAWTKVKEVFSAGGKVFEGVKDGIVEAFKTVVNAIIRGLNKVIPLPFKGLNVILDKIQNLEIVGIKPFDWVSWRAPIPEIPELERGGVLKRGQVGLLEGNGAEAVVPLEKNSKWIRKTAADLKAQLEQEGVNGMGMGSVVNNYNFTQNNTSPKALNRLELYRRTKNQFNFAAGRGVKLATT